MRRLPVVAKATLIATAVALATGCDQEPQGFALPEGDADRGREQFVSLGCVDCHRVMGDDALAGPAAEPPMQIILGGPSSRVQTYGNLVTSIINPSHKIRRGDPKVVANPDGSSPMPNFNEAMTVQQLIDLTTYLKGYYQVWTPPMSYPPGL